MSQSTDPHANPAKPDEPPIRTAIVLTRARVVSAGGFTYHVPPGSVIGIRMLPKVTTFNPGADAKLIPAGPFQVGDVVENV